MIDLLMAKDPEFVVLCEDYNDCANALRYWGRSKAPEAETRVKEYRTLVPTEDVLKWAGELGEAHLRYFADKIAHYTATGEA